MQNEEASIGLLAKLIKGNGNETTTCENLQEKIQQLVLERDTLASKNVELKKEIEHLHKLWNFDELQKIMYFN